MSLKLQEYGNVGSINKEDMTPESYFDDKDHIDETYDSTGDGCADATREYANAQAIVVWPRKYRWKVVTNNDVSRMVKYLSKACEEGTVDSEPR